MKNQLQSKTVWTSIIIGIVSLLILVGVIDPANVDLSPDAAWVGIAWSIVQYVLRLVTKDPVKKSTNKAAVLIFFLLLILNGCSASSTIPNDNDTDEIGTDKLTDVVNLYYKSAESIIQYLETKENALAMAVDLFYDIKSTIKDFNRVTLEAKNLSNQEVIDLVALIKNYNLGTYKKYFETACKLGLFGLQEKYKYYKRMEGKSESIQQLISM